MLSEREEVRSLPPEPWGSRMQRARRLAGLTLDEAAEAVNEVILTTGSTIGRLEARPDVPTGPQQRSVRRRAFCLLRLYGFDPAEFDLDPDDGPAGLRLVIDDRPRPSSAWVTGDDQRTPSSGWVTGDDQEPVAA